MSLRVWLPLDGDLKQQGTSGLQATNSGFTVENAGKIGKCYKTDGAGTIQISNFSLSPNCWSAACWCYPSTNSTSGHKYVFGMNTSTSDDFTFTICHYLNAWGVRTGGTTYSGTSQITLNQWYHVAATYDGTTLKLYVNGTLEMTKQSPVTPVASNTVIIGKRGGNAGYFIGCLNDVRIYDHCLSAAEVKEIAQGLVLHYKLDNNGLGGKNLLRNSNFMVEATKDTPASGVPSSMPFTEDLQQLVGKTFTLSYEVYTPGARKNGVNGGSLNNRFGCHLTLKYTPSGGSQTTVYPCAAHLTTTVNERNQRLVQTYTVPSNCTINSFGISVQPYAQPADDNDAVWRLGKIKLEYGNKATSYSPALEDYGWPNDIIEDSSGYGHHGSIVSSPYVEADTARYSCSTHFDGIDDCIQVPYNAVCPSNIFTFNLWFKKITLGTENYETLFGGPSGFEMDTRSGSATSLQLYMTSTRSTKRNLVTPLDFNQWYMVTMTRSDEKERYYINGIFQSEIDAKSMPTGTYWIGGWNGGNSQNFFGNISDFRIYNTVLSNDDILELYHTAAKIDNLGNIHTFEATESGHNKVTKAGLLESANICEIDGLSYLKYDPNVYIEPDGSAWVRIYHHNNPGAGSFSGSNDFAHSVYLDENRWFNVEVCDHIDKWEFMVKGRFTKNGDDWKVRWIQNVNPMTAAYADVAAANVTKITGNGYDAYKSSWGGLYAKKGSAYLTTNNGNSGNWWGAVGSYSVYRSGIPGWGPSDTVTTTGFNDLYVRIDNLGNDSPTQAKTTKNNLWVGHSFIEK